jgi:hypothetical protein
MLEPGQTLALLKLLKQSCRAALVEFFTSTFAPALRAHGDICPAR